MGYEIIPTILLVLLKTLGIYSTILIIRVLLTWFPNLDMSNPILVNLCAITDPYLNFFRGIIPPLGGLDLSPILAFVSLQKRPLPIHIPVRWKVVKCTKGHLQVQI